jgi:hypothetical protein
VNVNFERMSNFERKGGFDKPNLYNNILWENNYRKLFLSTFFVGESLLEIRVVRFLAFDSS